MTAILVFGENPPYLVGDAKIEAAHYRTAQFLEALLADGHTVNLIAPPASTSEGRVNEAYDSRFSRYTVDFQRQGWPSECQRILEHSRAACIVAVNFDYCLYATKLRTGLPMWMDIYGDPITIMQAAAFRAGSGRGLSTVIGFLTRALKRGDAFSVCSLSQHHMLVGELAMVGRLNQHTFGYDFAHVVPPAVISRGKLHSANEQQQQRGLTEYGVPAAAFIVLWAGGYNTWTDVDTLFRGLEFAMSQRPEIVFVSLGENSYIAADNVYDRFKRLIDGSVYKDRFYLLGWQPWTAMPAFYRTSDVGINIDAHHYETTYGTRTRLVEMIGAGLPVLTSYGSELSDFLASANAALGFRHGDYQQFGIHLVDLAKNPGKTRALAQNAASLALQALSVHTTSAPIRSWVEAPQPAPDRYRQSARQKLYTVEYSARAHLRWLLWRLRGSYR